MEGMESYRLPQMETAGEKGSERGLWSQTQELGDLEQGLYHLLEGITLPSSGETLLTAVPGSLHKSTELELPRMGGYISQGPPEKQSRQGAHACV